MGIMATDGGGNRSEVFWGEIAPCDHLLQIYPDDGVNAHALLSRADQRLLGAKQAGRNRVVAA